MQFENLFFIPLVAGFLSILSVIFLSDDGLSKIKEVGELIFTLVKDAVFIIVWGIIQYFVSQIIHHIGDEFNYIDILVWNAFQIIFAVATIIPLILRIYKETLIELQKINKIRK